ncbi:MAG: thermonuclease family protein [Lacipirellulaceae bacterium]
MPAETWRSRGGQHALVASPVRFDGLRLALTADAGGTIQEVAIDRLDLVALARVTPPEPLAEQPLVLFGLAISFADGDTLRVLDATGRQTRVRLEGIDAPEAKQAFGAKSRSAAMALARKRPVRVFWGEQDKYHRTLGHVFIRATQGEPEVWLNERMVRDGWAWHYDEYSDDQRLESAEREARTAKSGLWAESSPPEAPWDYRRRLRAAAAAKRQPAAPPAAFAPGVARPPASAPAALDHWLNVKTGVRHNSGCRFYGSTNSGRACGASEGTPCGICHG